MAGNRASADWLGLIVAVATLLVARLEALAEIRPADAPTSSSD